MKKNIIHVLIFILFQTLNLNIYGYENLTIGLSSVIDLESRKENSFIYANVFLIKTYYKQVTEDDIPFIIENKNNIEKVKEYFFKKKLNFFQEIKELNNNFYKRALFIPQNIRGLYFCAQKVYTDKKNFVDYIQIYNFSDNKIIGIDSEDSVIIYSMLKSEKGAKLNIYSQAGKLVRQTTIDKSGIQKIPNYQYNELYVSQDAPYKALFKIQFNKMKKVDYNIFAIYEKTNTDFYKIHGIISCRNGKPLKNASAAVIELNLYKKNNLISTRRISKINNKGVFYAEVEKKLLLEKNTTVIFKVNKIYEKKYELNFNYNTREINSKAKNIEDILKLKEDVILNDKIRLEVKNEYADKISSIFYSFLNNKNIYKNNIDIKNLQRSGNEIIINYTGEQEKLFINFEIFLSNGNMLSQEINVTKPDITKKKNYNPDEYLLVKLDGFEGIEKKLNFFNPFTEYKAILILYNNDIQYYSELELLKGYNNLSIDQKKILFPNLNSLIVLYDLKSDRKIYYCKNLMQTEIIKKLEGKIKEEEQSINLELDLKRYAGYDAFVGFSANEKYIDPVFNSLFYFRNFYENEDAVYKLNEGRKILIDNSFKNLLEFNNNSDYRLDLTLFISNNLFYNFHKAVKRNSNLDVQLIGPDYINILDKPVYRLKIKNLTGNNNSLNFVVSSNNGIAESNINRLILEKWQTGTADITINNFESGFPIELLFEIYSENMPVERLVKKINFRNNYSYQTAEISGKIFDDRTVSNYLKVPDFEVYDFNVELFISSDKRINLFKKNFNIFNINYEFFELNLLKFLDIYLSSFSQAKNINYELIESFYVKNKGFKKFLGDKNIDIDCTLIFLFAAKNIPELNKKFNLNEILDNILVNYKKEILNSASRLFVLSEYGILLEEINENFLKSINNKSEALYFYKYYIKYFNNFEKAGAFNKILFINEQVNYPLLSLYFKIEEINTDNIEFYSSITNAILMKILAVKFLNEKALGVKNLYMKFSSKQLGEIEANLSKEDLIYKRYDFKIYSSFYNQSKLIDFKIEKKGNNELYYTVRASYKSFPEAYRENRNIKVETEYINKEGKAIDIENEQLNTNEVYYVKFIVKNQVRLANVLIKPIECMALDADYSEAIINQKAGNNLKTADNYIKEANLEIGENIITYRIIPRFPGKYIFYGNVLIDINDINNYMQDKTGYINIK